MLIRQYLLIVAVFVALQSGLSALVASLLSHGQAQAGDVAPALPPPSPTPLTQYAWARTPTGTNPAAQPGFERLSGMTYPQQPGTTARTLSLGYGAWESADNRLSHIASLSTNFGTPTVAEFSYAGVSRRSRLATAAAALVVNFAAGAGVGLPALDTYGRVKDLHWQNAATPAATLFRAQHTYDASGNRLTAKITQVPVAGVPQDNIYSQLSTYDALGRMVSTTVGALDGSNQIPSPYRRDDWALDLLGNWAGSTSPAAPGRYSQHNVDGFGKWWAAPGADSDPDQVSLRHDVTVRNEIANIFADDDEAPPPVNTDTDYDAAGNIVFDGEYYYQYDAWGRLLQVNKASRPGGGSIVITDLVKHHTYDGLGRLVRTESPYPAPGQSGGQLRSERFYYDGIRRIQEVVLDSLADMAMAGGDPQLEQILDETTPNSEELDGDTATLGYEEGQAAAGGGGGGGPVYRGIAREYIWGPGDNGVDELLVQYDEQGYEWWAVQDAGGDLVALCDLGGSGGTARVVGQWTYDAYGAVVTYDQLFPFALPHLGHKGLFFDRLDAGVLDGQGLESPRLAPFARVNYHVRNRNYDPAMGRWNQRDPNGTALALLNETGFYGASLAPKTDLFDLQSHFGDGPNVYEYLGSNLWDRSDPLGLLFGYDDLIMWGVGGMRGGLEEMTGQYADNQLADVEWATDWEMDDDWHTRSDNSWVEVSFALGFYRGMMEEVRESFFAHEVEWAVGSGGSAGNAMKAGKAAKRIRSMRDLNRLEVHESYDAALKAKEAAGIVGADAHHVVAQGMGGQWRRNVREGGGPCVNVEQHFHRSNIKSEFNAAYRNLNVNPKRLTQAQAEAVVKMVYRSAPKLRNEALKYIRGH